MNTLFLMDALSITLIVVGAILVIFLIGVGAVLLRNRKSKKLSVNLRNQYNDYHEILTVTCFKHLNRLKQLGLSNEKYQSLYDEKLDKYNDILAYRDRDTYLAINEFSVTFNRDKNQFKRKLGPGERKDRKIKAVRMTNEYIKAVSSFNEELNSLLHEDTDTKDSTISVKGKYRKAKDFYEAHQQELSFVSRSYEIILSDAEKVFDKFAELTNQARYDEAKDLLPQIDGVLSAVISIQDDLPSLVAKVTVVLPQSIEEVENAYNEMLAEDYKFNTDVEGEINRMKEEVEDMKKRLRVLDVSTLDQRIDNIQQCITNLHSSFESEKIAKKDYLDNKGKIGDNVYELEKRHSRYLNQIPAYKNAYVLDNRYIEQMQDLKGEIESINSLKRELDSSITTNVVTEPYSVLNKNINEVLKGIGKANRIIDDYVTYTTSLRELSQQIYTDIRKCFIRLKECESNVREIKMCDYANKVLPALDDLYKRLEEIDSILMKQPLDVNAAFQKYSPFIKDADNLVNKIQDDYDEYQKAQYALMKAMKYKADFTDSQPDLDAAELAFSRSDFQTALVKANGTVKTFSGFQNENV